MKRGRGGSQLMADQFLVNGPSAIEIIEINKSNETACKVRK